MLPKDTEIYHVAIMFEEPEINCLFAELIGSRGIRTRIIQPNESVAENERCITEPQFLNNLPSDKKDKCLLIGNKDAMNNLPGIKLPRPLTESKIMQAIEEFLS